MYGNGVAMILRKNLMKSIKEVVHSSVTQWFVMGLKLVEFHLVVPKQAFAIQVLDV